MDVIYLLQDLTVYITSSEFPYLLHSLEVRPLAVVPRVDFGLISLEISPPREKLGWFSPV